MHRCLRGEDWVKLRLVVEGHSLPVPAARFRLRAEGRISLTFSNAAHRPARCRVRGSQPAGRVLAEALDPSPARAHRSRHSLGSSSRLETVFPLRPTAVSGGSPAYGWSGLRAYRYFCFCPSRRESRPSGRAMFYSGSFCSPSMVSSAEACAARVPGCPPPRLMV